MSDNRVVLAYSGGLDTSVAVRWLQEKYGMSVVTMTCDLGQGKELESVRKKALDVGAIAAKVVDARDFFAEQFVFPALMAGAMYEGKYPLATALARPLIAWHLIQTAREYNATAVAHGCTGKGNDQVRFELTFQTLAPELKIIAPVREWKFNRTEELEYAQQHNIPVEFGASNNYSVDQNLWGRSIEAGNLEDPWIEPPPGAFSWTVDPVLAPDKPDEIEIEFVEGKPTAINGRTMSPVELIVYLNDLGGRHGVGRIDHVESRLIGIKSREIYEAPAAVILHQAHRELESLTLSRIEIRFKQYVSSIVSEIVYDGLWFTTFHQNLMGFIHMNQRFVTGTVRCRLYKGQVTVCGRKSQFSLYKKELATYEHGDQFPHDAAIGFIRVHGLAHQIQAQQQLLPDSSFGRAARILPQPNDEKSQ